MCNYMTEQLRMTTNILSVTTTDAKDDRQQRAEDDRKHCDENDYTACLFFHRMNEESHSRSLSVKRFQMICSKRERSANELFLHSLIYTHLHFFYVNLPFESATDGSTRPQTSWQQKCKL